MLPQPQPEIVQAVESIAATPADSHRDFAHRTGDAVSAQGLAASGLGGFVLAWALAANLQIMDPAAYVPIFIVFTSVPMIALSIFALKTHRRASSGLTHLFPARPEYGRCALKFLGLLFTVSVLGFLYWLFPEYRREFYQPVWQISAVYALPVIFLAAVYIAAVDGRMAQPCDGYWHAGLVALGRWREADAAILREHALGWLVKGFFLPLMIASAAGPLGQLLEKGWDFSTFGSLYVTSISLVYSLDVIWGVLGYSLTLRALDSQIRSTEPTALGWVSAIFCYIPFSTFIWGSFLNYKGKIDWSDWLEAHPIIYITWGLAILLLLGIYVWATISFGCRFSNLTHRGIIVDGPYRLMKHPAYVSKNLAWWLMAVPFCAHATWLENLQACVCLALTNGIYFLRARTEERHLGKDPAYLEYAKWVERNGLVGQIMQLNRMPLRDAADHT